MTRSPQPAASPAPPQPQPTRIGRRFDELRRVGRLGLVVYLTAGDPSLEAGRSIALAVAEAGADVIELGVPFSDPIADGPVIQRASERALRSGTTLEGVIGLVSELRRSTQIPLVLFSYFNPILQMGLGNFARRAAAAGADGVLATDLTPEEAGEYRAALRDAGLDTIFLAAPTTTDERIARIAASTSGFLYLISRTGVTGSRIRLPEDLDPLLGRARRATSVPLAVGFGLSRPEHLRALAGKADAAIVGSALVEEIERASSPAAAAVAVANRVRALMGASHDG